MLQADLILLDVGLETAEDAPPVDPQSVADEPEAAVQQEAEEAPAAQAIVNEGTDPEPMADDSVVLPKVSEQSAAIINLQSFSNS